MNDAWWNRLTLSELSTEQWEQLCDGCGQCCLHVLEDDETGEFVRTSVHCRYLDPSACRCTDYANRLHNVPACVALTPTTAALYDWLPSTCAYRLRAVGLPLPDWHPLETNDSNSVHHAGISARGRIISEEFVPEDHMDEYVMHWVGQGD
ncbi:MAG: YcgN family cysteine cluster protein [Chromatocurvus sp.]